LQSDTLNTTTLFGFHSSYHRIYSSKRPTLRYFGSGNRPDSSSVLSAPRQNSAGSVTGRRRQRMRVPLLSFSRHEPRPIQKSGLGTRQGIATLPSVIITLPSFLLILSTESAHTMCKLLFFAFFCHFGFASRFTRSLWKGTGTLKSDMRLTWLPRPEVLKFPDFSLTFS